MEEQRIPHVRKTIYTTVVKRLLDILLSGAALIVLSPVFLVITILELIYHGRPVLFTQERPGKDEKLFKVYKFRSMTNETDENGVLLPNEKRLTKFGKKLRRLSLDELPELFCIFTGKMSIIGPRPLRPQYLQYYTERHHYRHAVRPGLMVYPLKPRKSWTWNDQFENDIWYVENCSFSVDIRMVYIVLKNAVSGGETRADAIRKRLTEDYWREDKVEESISVRSS